jgi:hypothetical protein
LDRQQDRFIFLEKDHPRKNIMSWDSTDAKPMPDEGILRDFDLNPRYGPCCTLNRRERFDRALSLGLSPPVSVERLIESTGNPESVLDVHLRQISTSGSFR